MLAHAQMPMPRCKTTGAATLAASPAACQEGPALLTIIQAMDEVPQHVEKRAGEVLGIHAAHNPGRGLSAQPGEGGLSSRPR